MEEIIGLSGYEVNLEQIWRRLCCVLLVVLLVSGLYYVAETYEAALSGSGETEAVQKRTHAAEGADSTDLAGEDMLLLAEPSNMLDGVTDMERWKETVIPKTQEEQVSHTGLLGAQGDTAGNLPVSEQETVPGEAQATPVPAVLTIHLHGNGGTPDMTTFTEPLDALLPEAWSIPFRLGKVFDGWYLDAGCTIPFSEVEEGVEQLEVYAGWKELAGFVSDDAGHITSCAAEGVIQDGILALPSDMACTGIESGALAAVADQVTEIYIPANITYIGEGAFENLPNLMYIEAAAGNPNYYSEGGILYTASGEMIACPAWYTVE